MSTRARMLTLLLLPSLALTACGDKDTDDSAPPDCDPVANAGDDLSVAFGDTVTLNGCPDDFSQTCPNEEYTYLWTIESVPVDSDLDESLLSDNNSDTACETSFTPDATGTYVLSMVMNDGMEDTEPDLVIVSVASGNQAPVADCGSDVDIEVGESAQLDGSASYDPEGAAIEYSWALSSGPDDSELAIDDVFNADADTPTIIPDVPGVYLVSLVVSDGEQWSEPDYCTVTASAENQAPVADAGISDTLPPCADNEIQLNGYGSYDPEGQQVTFLWDVLEVPPGSHADGSLDSGDTGPAGTAAFDDPTSPTPVFTWDVIGTYVFQLSVFDGDFWSAPDVVTYIVPDPSTNTAPVANAGEDVEVNAETICDLISYGVHECEPCEGQTFEIDGTLTADPDGDEINYYWSDALGELDIHTPYNSFTQVTTPVVEVPLGTTYTTSWEVLLEASDCMYSSTDTTTVTFTCEATY